MGFIPLVAGHLQPHHLNYQFPLLLPLQTLMPKLLATPFTLNTFKVAPDALLLLLLFKIAVVFMVTLPEGIMKLILQLVLKFIVPVVL
jgi:hypothetical protein